MTDNILIKTTNGKFQRRKQTYKQMMFLHYLSQGYSKRQSMLKAGYAVSSANVPKAILSKPSMKAAIATMEETMIQAGLSQEYAAAKLAELLEARKTINGQETPDYQVQIESFRIWFKLIQEFASKKETKPARKLTIQEWINSS